MMIMDCFLRTTETIFAAVFLVLLCLHSGSYAQECTAGTATTWVGIPEESYDRNFTSVNDPNGRPVGFVPTFIPYSDLMQPNPCIVVTGTMDSRVEVMAESNPQGSIICVKDEYNREICDAQIYDCRQADGDSLRFEFHCDATSCDESDVQFFYRFTVSPPGDVRDPELWCDERDTGEYPSSLYVPLPTNMDLATKPPDRTNSAIQAATPSKAFALLTSVFVLLSLIGPEGI
ncbi:uncharacterized protein LOC117305716 [Asterias rubens]|uniref:uncharacterized protein LOC117305716 n=1 Tax=Asterias rubens TaxID=7604 RepID=UPI001455BBE2|nr:uncharacterized protein LOC117305716 [Asterias rubens]